jgi:ATP-dependent RNA helicase DeaD
VVSVLQRPATEGPQIALPPALTDRSDPPDASEPETAAPPFPTPTRRRNTWSCLTRRPGQPWRIAPPIGPAMPARWAGQLSAAGGPRDARPASDAGGGKWDAPDFFGALPLTEPARRAVWEAGYRQPTPVQALCIPLLLEGKDVVGQAHTGTGKTAAFGLPIVERVDPRGRDVQAVIVVPTRELCRQVTGELERLGRYRGISVLAVYGGEGMDRQLRALAAGGVHVVVGTPGRVLDHIWRGTLKLDGVRICILDEADEMLDIGFAEDIDKILRCMPRERQTALFSATIPPFVHRLVRRYLEAPEWISTVGESTAPAARIPTQIRQEFVQVAERDKLAAVEELIQTEPGYDRVLVFRRMKITADRLAQQMQRRGLSARALHGDLPQAERNRVLEDFRAGRIRFLVATNVAARGLDIRDVSHVLNYDLPETPDEYTHRIGRTGRAGKAGTAISFVAEWDLDSFEAIKGHVGGALHERQLKLYS